MTTDEYVAHRHVTYQMGQAAAGTLVDAYVASENIARQVQIAVQGFMVAPSLVQGTNLVTVVPARAAALMTRLYDVRMLPAPFPFPLLRQALWWNPTRATDPLLQWMRMEIERSARALPTLPDLPRGDDIMLEPAKSL